MYIDRALLLDKGTNWVYSAFSPKDAPTKIHLSNNSLLLLNSLFVKTVPTIYTTYPQSIYTRHTIQHSVNS